MCFVIATGVPMFHMCTTCAIGDLAYYDIINLRDINTEFMPLAFEIYGAASDSVDKLIQSFVSKASQRTFVPYHVLLFYWRKRISYTLQYFNAWIINQAYLKLNNCGGGNIHRNFDLENIS